MAKRRVRISSAWERWAARHKLGIIAGDLSPAGLVEWLNATAGKSYNARISRVIALLQKDRTVQSLANLQTDAEKKRALGRIISTPESRLELDELLLKYWVSPRLLFFEDGPQLFYVSAKKARAGVTLGEIGALMGVMQLGSRDELDRLRTCQCGKFFFAARIDQIYCKTKCRVKHHQASKEFKIKRRKYQRELYRLKKSGKVK